MPGVGASGGYGPPLNTLGMTGIEYPPGPAGWTANADWSAMPGSVFRAADLNQQMSLPLDYLTCPPMFQAIQQTSQTIPANTGPSYAFSTQALTMDTPLVDSWGMWSPDSNIAQWQIPTGMDGVYIFSTAIPMTVEGANFSYQAHGQDSYLGLAGYQCGQVTASSGQVMMQFMDMGLYQGGDMVNVYPATNSTTAVPTAVVQGNGNSPSVSAIMSGRWVASNLVTSPLPAGYSFPLTVPTPTAWTSGEDLTSDSLNSQIRDSLVFLANRPYCRLFQTTNQTVPNGTTALTGMTPVLGGRRTAAIADPWGCWNTSAQQWTAPIAGLYLCCLYVGLQLTSNTTAFSTNPSLVAVQSGVSASLSGGKTWGPWPGSYAFRTIRFAKGDTMTFNVFQNSGASMPTNGSTFFSLWLRP